MAANRGGIEREQLTELVSAGLTVREIAAHVDRSYTTVRYWLRFHGLETSRAARLRAGGRPRNTAPIEVTIECPRHGSSRHVLRGNRYRCARCNSEAVSRFRRRVKATLVAEAGGACVLCGYSRCIGVLQFHHVDPSRKRFALSLSGVARSIDSVRAEAAKCVLLCANCHGEVEMGVATLSPDGHGRG